MCGANLHGALVDIERSFANIPVEWFCAIAVDSSLVERPELKLTCFSNRPYAWAADKLVNEKLAFAAIGCASPSSVLEAGVAEYIDVGVLARRFDAIFGATPVVCYWDGGPATEAPKPAQKATLIRAIIALTHIAGDDILTAEFMSFAFGTGFPSVKNAWGASTARARE
jgi:hypothetical protein